MELLPTAMILAGRTQRGQMFSALPDAPVVPTRPSRAPVRRTRAVTAHLLERAASAVAPKPTCTPAH